VNVAVVAFFDSPLMDSTISDTFSSCAVLLAARWAGDAQDDSNTYWQAAMETLRIYSSTSAAAVNSLKALEVLKEQLDVDTFPVDLMAQVFELAGAASQENIVGDPDGSFLDLFHTMF
jgi:hypothetical protein